MDYDENEFQSQNLHLAREENSKFPPVLRPYALPKFEFDDHLQGSLRFDSLVEAGTFLGIENNEDNQWIEDYSRGAGEIQFSPGAVDACSISRRSNVWSEATSSESVEMLLKSVGQDEIIPLPTDNKVLDSCDELGCIMKQMDPNVIKDCTASPDVRDTTIPTETLHSEAQDNVGSLDSDSGLIAERVLDNLESIGISSVLPGMSSSAYLHENVDETSDSENMITTTESQVGTSFSFAQHGEQEDLNVNSRHVSLSAATNSSNEINSLKRGVEMLNDPIMRTSVTESVPVIVCSVSALSADVQVSVTNTNLKAAEDAYGSLSNYGNTILDNSKKHGSKEAISTDVLHHVNGGHISGEKSNFSVPSATDSIDENLSTQNHPLTFPHEEKGCGTDVAEDEGKNHAGDHLIETPSPIKDSVVGAESAKIDKDVPNSFPVSGEVINDWENGAKLENHVTDCERGNIVVAIGPSVADVQESSLSTDKTSNFLCGRKHEVERDHTVLVPPAVFENENMQGVKESDSASAIPILGRSICNENDKPGEIPNEVSEDASSSGRGLKPLSDTDIESPVVERKILKEAKDLTSIAVGKGNNNEVNTENIEQSPQCDHDLHRKELNASKVSDLCELSVVPGSSSERQTLTDTVPASSGVDAHSDDCLEDETKVADLVTSIPSHEYQQLGNIADKGNATRTLNNSGPLPETSVSGLSKNDTTPTDLKQIEATIVTTSSNHSSHVVETSEQVTPMNSHAVVRRNPKASGTATSHGRTKGISDGKPRRSSTKVLKDSAKKNTETFAAVGKGEKAVSVTANPSTSSQLLQSAAAFQQSFTDGQQVQLRAQILVYGALIQGIVPDEACMISSFGEPDGRNVWDKAWRLCIERQQSSKLHLNTPETPLTSRLGPRTSDQSLKQGSHDTKLASASQLNRKNSTFVSPMLPFSAPLWSMATPSVEVLQPNGIPRVPVSDIHRSVLPLHPQSSPIRNYVGQSPSWITQTPFCGPWVASPSNAMHDPSNRLSVPKINFEPTPVLSAKDSSAQHPSVAKLMGPGPLPLVEFCTGMGTEAVTSKGSVHVSSSVQSVVETKARKRKKSTLSGNAGENINKVPQNRLDSVNITDQPQCSVTMSLATEFVSKPDVEKPIRFLSTTPYTDLIKVNEDTEKKTVLPEEILAKVKEARILAEDASTFAAIAVNHSQETWKQLDQKKNFGLLPENEMKLSSAFLAVSAAAAVAKAAAAAANVASNAALQAKMMADEAIGSDGHATSGKLSSLSKDSNNLGKASPVSILKGNDGMNSSTAILGAARETARRRVEAASAASKQAENMDAIVKAAELAADAVSQAGKIVAMGDPLPISELVANRADGHVRGKQVASEFVSRQNNVGNAGASQGPAWGLKDDRSSKGDIHNDQHGQELKEKEKFSEDNLRLIDVISGKATFVSGKGSGFLKEAKGQKGRKLSDLAKTDRVIQSGTEVRSHNSYGAVNKLVAAVEIQSDIKEGSLVEVYKDSGELAAAWFCADVISLSHGKAHVCYTDLMLGEEKLKEWVELKTEGEKAPKIRIARPPNVLQLEGTRKRRRPALEFSRWSVGDRVDAWIMNSWSEGVIAEKNQNDESILRVYFPVTGETVAVKAWHLRPSLIWKDGEWAEWSSLEEKSGYTGEGDVPAEKRARIRSPVVDAKQKDKSSKAAEAIDINKRTEPTLLDLTASEKIFNMSKSSSDHRPGTLRMTRTGLQKQGSRVIFGVPKPGKKRKFMEVSKHYVADQGSKSSHDGNDNAKFVKYVMPQGPLRGSRNNSKPAANEKSALFSKSKLGKPQTAFGRSIPQKDQPSLVVSAPDDSSGDAADLSGKTRDVSSHGENSSKHHFDNSDTDEGPIIFSSFAHSSDVLSSKRASSSKLKASRASKGKLAPASGRLGKIEEEKVREDISKAALDAEPRRSNRRIQPTSRLLEGLQLH